MTKIFKFTQKQSEAQQIISGQAKHVMLFGGSRSGKTFLHTRNVVMRALKAENSRHGIFRLRFNSVKSSVILDTFPTVMRLIFPDVQYKLDKTDWYASFPNGSTIWFGGLDDNDRTEKILGMEFATLFFNECSQIPYSSIQIALTRLAQNVMQDFNGMKKQLRPRAFYDENPPTKGHWTYKLFIQKMNPETRESLKNHDDYAYFKINPIDNKENIADDYLDVLSSMSGRMRKRFLDGEFGEAIAGALFDDSSIEAYRIIDGGIPDMVRIVVAVDPSGSGDMDNADNDAIGIVVVGLGTDGIAYVLEDCTVKAGPATWGNVATTAFERHNADVIVGETNYGGDMVRHVIHTARPRTPFRKVTASRGKVVRAEPFSSLYERGKVRHVGFMRQLEDELCAFTTNGYIGELSPNRADALIWGLAELFPAIIKQKKEIKKTEPERPVGGSMSWMG